MYGGLMQDMVIVIDIESQSLCLMKNFNLVKRYLVSTAKNGPGEEMDSECTPRGKHHIYGKIGGDAPLNSVFVARRWTGEIYTPELHQKHLGRDWILTRILRLAGNEPSINKNGTKDSFLRYIYIHGTPDSTVLGSPGSRGCIRMSNRDIIDLFGRVSLQTPVLIV